MDVKHNMIIKELEDTIYMQQSKDFIETGQRCFF